MTTLALPRPFTLRPATSRALRHAYLVVGAMFAVYLFAVVAPIRGTFGFDAYAYWSAAPPLYDKPVGALGAYLYSPAFYQLTEPLRLLGWPAFVTIWAAITVATAVWMGPMALAFPFVAVEVYHGNIHLLIAAAIIIGFRYPVAWAFVLHTKATCGVGLLWFAARGEWRKFATALAAAAAIAAVSLVFMPGAWVEYVTFLVGAAGKPDPLGFSLPLLVRLPIAVAVVLWGARTDRRWTVPVAAMLALPNLWWQGVAVAAGAVALRWPARWTQPYPAIPKA